MIIRVPLNTQNVPCQLGLIWGVRGIARVINQTERQTLYLLETGQLPAGKSGRKWYSSESRLLQHFAIDPGEPS